MKDTLYLIPSAPRVYALKVARFDARSAWCRQYAACTVRPSDVPALVAAALDSGATMDGNALTLPTEEAAEAFEKAVKI